MSVALKSSLLVAITLPLFSNQIIDLSGPWDRWIADVRLDSVPAGGHSEAPA